MPAEVDGGGAWVCGSRGKELAGGGGGESYGVNIILILNFQVNFRFERAVMKLRHKKPLNPYKGQTNSDKNEFNDDDFRQQGTPHKKLPVPSSEQIYKYARLMQKFVKSVNEQSRLYPQQDPKAHLSHPEKMLPEVASQEFLRPLDPGKQREQSHPKQNTRIQASVDHRTVELRDPKGTPVKRNQSPVPKPPGPPIRAQDTIMGPKGITTVGKKAPQNRPPQQGLTPATQRTGQPAANGPMAGMGVPANMPGGMAMPYNNMMDLQRMATMMGGMGGGNSGGMNNNMMMNQFSQMNQMNMNQLMRLVNSSNGAAGNGMNMANMQNMLYGGFPMGMNMQGMQGMQGMTGMGPMGMMGQVPPGVNPQNNQQKPHKNLFSEHVKSVLLDSGRNNPNKAIFPLKRASYHAAITYTIYLDKLKKNGLNLDQLQNLEEIDPTRHARRVKTQSGKNKGGDKKKK